MHWECHQDCREACIPKRGADKLTVKLFNVRLDSKTISAIGIHEAETVDKAASGDIVSTAVALDLKDKK